MESRNDERAPAQRQPQPSQRASAEQLSEPTPPPATPTQAELDQMAEGTYNPTTAGPPETPETLQKRERDALEAKHKRELQQLEQRQRTMTPQTGSGYTTR